MKAASRCKKKHTAAFCRCFLKTKLKPLKFSFLTSFAVVVLPLRVSVILTIAAMEAAGPRAADLGTNTGQRDGDQACPNTH